MSASGVHLRRLTFILIGVTIVHGLAKLTLLGLLLSIIAAPVVTGWAVGQYSGVRRSSLGTILVTAGSVTFVWYVSIGVTRVANGTAEWYQIAIAPVPLFQALGFFPLALELLFLGMLAIPSALVVRSLGHRAGTTSALPVRTDEELPVDAVGPEDRPGLSVGSVRSAVKSRALEVGTGGRKAVEEMVRKTKTTAVDAGARGREWLRKEASPRLEKPKADSASVEPVKQVRWNGVNLEARFAQRLTSGEKELQRAADLAPLAPRLSTLLEEGETVLFSCRGATPYTIADYVAGILLFIWIRRAMFVLTDRRFLVIPCYPDFSPKRSLSSFHWGDVTGWAIDAGFGIVVHWKLALQYASGRRETLMHLTFGDAQVIREIVALHTSPGASRGEFPERVHRCIECGAPIPPGHYSCRCGQGYCNPETARVRALVIPGGGYLYTGHPLIGALDALVETFLFLNGLALLVAGVLGVGARFISIGLFFLGLFVFEKVVSLHHVQGLVDERVPVGPWKLHRADEDTGAGWRIAAHVFAGLLFILIGLGVYVRIPHFFDQIRIARHVAWLESDGAEVRRAGDEIKRLDDEIDTTVERLRDWEHRRRGSHTVIQDPELPFTRFVFSDPQMRQRYDEDYDRYLSLVAERDAKNSAWESDFAAYDARLREIEELEARIGDAWTSMTPADILRDLVRW